MSYYGSKPVSAYFEESKMSDLETTFAGQIRAMGLPDPVREHKPIAGRKFACDFAWPEYGIAVEIEGGVYAAGDAAKGHGGGAAYERNCEKYALMLLEGWAVLRGGPNQVVNGTLLGWLVTLIGQRRGE
jgi:hypothetical protein